MHLSEGRALGSKYTHLYSCLYTHIHVVYCTIISRATDYKP